MSTTKDQAAQTATYPPDLLQGSLEVGKEEPRHPGVKQFSLQALQQGGCQDLHPPSLAHSLAEVFQSTAGPWANPLIGNTVFCQEGDRNTWGLHLHLEGILAGRTSGAFHLHVSGSLTGYQSLLHFPIEGHTYFQAPTNFSSSCLFLVVRSDITGCGAVWVPTASNGTCQFFVSNRKTCPASSSFPDDTMQFAELLS